MTPKPTKPNDEEDDVFGFLLGENSLNGFNFGDEQSGVPKYWWRSNLRKAITKREHLAELRARLDEVGKLDQDAGRDEWLYGYAATRRFELQQQLEEAENN